MSDWDELGNLCPTCGLPPEECDWHTEETRQEAREKRVDNGRKMRVTGRSTLLLGALSAGQQRRRVSRRKAGKT